jgi:hypothetical protein
MLKALAHDQEGKPIVFLGITEENVKKLKEGLPIHMNMADLDGELTLRMFLLYGENEEALKDLLLGNPRQVSVKNEIHDKPQSLRENLISAVDELIERVERSEECDEALQRARDALELLRD